MSAWSLTCGGAPEYVHRLRDMYYELNLYSMVAVIGRTQVNGKIVRSAPRRIMSIAGGRIVTRH